MDVADDRVNGLTNADLEIQSLLAAQLETAFALLSRGLGVDFNGCGH